MSEVNEEPRPQPIDIRHYVNLAGRHHIHFLIPFFVGWLAVWTASWLMPPRYKSSTQILVQQPTMPQDYVTPNINDNMQTRLESLQQQILSRTRLLMIINKLHLYGGHGTHATSDAKIEQMRKNIDITLIRDPHTGAVSSFRVDFSARDPKLAQTVTKELTSLFISQNQQVLTKESQGTTRFLEKQLADARASLAEQEATVRRFKSQHMGDLPTQQASNLQILAGLQSQLQSEQDSLNAAKQQQVYLQAMIEQERAAEGRAMVASAQAGTAAGANGRVTINQQLQTMKTQLAELSSRYTSEYPDVVNLKKQIKKLEAIQAGLVANAKHAGSPVAGAEGQDGVVLDSTLRQLQGQLKANQLEIQNREQAIAEYQARIGQYQGRLNLEPQTEQQLADLTRDYNQTKENYDDLLKKKNQSAMATNMEALQQGERLAILDPPSLPGKPEFPNRRKLCLVGLFTGLALGVIVAGGLEFMDDRIYSDKEIKGLLPMAVISEVPEVVSPLDQQKGKRVLLLRWVATAAVTVVILAGSAFSFLHG